MKTQSLRFKYTTQGKTHNVSASIGPGKPKRFHPDPYSPSLAGRAVVSGPRSWALETVRRFHLALKRIGYFTTTQSKSVAKGVTTFKIVILKYNERGLRRRARR